MKLPSLVAALLFGGASLGIAPAARAQLSNDLIMETYNSNINTITNGAINAATLRSTLERNGTNSPSRRSTGTKTSSRSTASANLTYTPTPALRQQTVQGYVTRLKASNPAASQAIAANFGPGKYDYGQIYRGVTKESGLRDNDAADVLAGYLIVGWMIVHNVQDGNAITVPMARGVRAQVAPLLANSASACSHAAQIGEELKLQTVVIQGGWQSASKEGSLPAYQRSIRDLFRKQYGMDMSLFKLTSQGFVKAG